MEDWKDVVGFEGIYQVSSKGKVKSLDRVEKLSTGNLRNIKGKILKPQPNSNGYLRVELKGNGRKERWFVHRLVAVHFVQNDNPILNTVVNHIDSDHLNNSADNLEWTTMKGNSQHALISGRMNRTPEWIEHLHKSKEKEYKPVIAYDKSTGEIVAVFKNVNDCARFGFQPSCVCNCCKGIRKTHKNLIWKYAENERG